MQATINQQQQIKNSIAMTVVLVSWAMFFATLFLCFAIYRTSTQVWPPMGLERVPLQWPLLSSLPIVLSSLTYFLFEKKGVRVPKEARKWCFFTIILGVLFLLCQIKLWSFFKLNGLYVSDGIFPSLLYGLTWTHAAHMVLGIVGLIYAFFSSFKKEGYEFKIKNIGLFWHFLTVIWAVMFFCLFIF